MPAYKRSHLDGETIYTKEHRARVLAEFLVRKTLLKLQVPYSNYEDAKEFVQSRFLEYTYALNAGGPAAHDQLLSLRASEVNQFNEVGKRIPYHPAYPAQWTQLILGTPIHEMSGVLIEELEHFARLTRTYYKFQLGINDYRYLQQILADELFRLETEADTQRDTEVQQERLRTALVWFTTEVPQPGNDMEVITTAEPSKLPVESTARAKKKTSFTLEECLIQPRFTRLELDMLLQSVGMADYNQEGKLQALASTKSWQWSVVRAAISDKGYFREVSHTTAAQAFKAAYRAKVGRETMGIEINKQEGKAKTKEGAFYAKLKALL
jgi:hypothetical protein